MVLVGQQDRRHLAQEPFLAGRLHGLAGDYPVWVDQPVRPQDVPGALARAWHEARTAPRPGARDRADGRLARPRRARPHEIAAPARLVPARAADAGRGRRARRPARAAELAGAGGRRGRRRPRARGRRLVALAERLGCPVWQESFGARAGFPQDHPLFAGHLPAGRAPAARARSPAHDLVLAVGAPAFRQYPYEPGPLVETGTRVALVTDDPAEAHRSPVDLAVLAAPAGRVRRARREACPSRAGAAPAAAGRPSAAARRRRRASRCAPAHVLAALAERLPRRHGARRGGALEPAGAARARCPPGEPLGFLSAAMGGLGFALPAAIGVRMALPSRPVVAVVGDGSALYSIQSLWSAARYGVGALFVILANGGYAVMDRLAEMQGEHAAVAGVRGDRHRGAWRGRSAARRETGRDATTSCCARSTRCVPGLADRERAAAARGGRGGGL